LYSRQHLQVKMSAQAPAVIPGIDNKHDINGVEDIEHDVKGETDTRGVIVTEEDVNPPQTSYEPS
jgi:hypothetical protein